jgi:hypothetical protein
MITSKHLLPPPIAVPWRTIQDESQITSICFSLGDLVHKYSARYPTCTFGHG